MIESYPGLIESYWKLIEIVKNLIDDLNRETPPDDWEPPERPRFEPDGLTRETHAWVRDRFDTWGTDGLEAFAWPVTRLRSRSVSSIRKGLSLGMATSFQEDTIPQSGRKCH
ncbi:MAG: cryptochrome/photolyase family protein [Pirellulaceae bacterium]